MLALSVDTPKNIDKLIQDLKNEDEIEHTESSGVGAIGEILTVVVSILPTIVTLAQVIKKILDKAREASTGSEPPKITIEHHISFVKEEYHYHWSKEEIVAKLQQQYPEMTE